MKRSYITPALVKSGDALRTTQVSGIEGAEGSQKLESIGSVGFGL